MGAELDQAVSRVRTSIEMDEEVIEAGRARARQDRRSFSNYLAVLIEQDTADTAALKPTADLTEGETPAS